MLAMAFSLASTTAFAQTLPATSPVSATAPVADAACTRATLSCTQDQTNALAKQLVQLDNVTDQASARRALYASATASCGVNGLSGVMSAVNAATSNTSFQRTVLRELMAHAGSLPCSDMTLALMTDTYGELLAPAAGEEFAGNGEDFGNDTTPNTTLENPNQISGNQPK